MIIRQQFRLLEPKDVSVNLAVPVIICVTLGKLLSLSESLYQYNGDFIYILLPGCSEGEMRLYEG